MEKFKTFPLTVSQKWLDKVDKLRVKDESKHDFIIKAVYNEFKRREINNGFQDYVKESSENEDV